MSFFQQKNFLYKVVSGTLVFMFLLEVFSSFAYASVTDGIIFTGENIGEAWSSNVGWVNFSLSKGNVHVTNTGLTGNAFSDEYGSIDLAPTNGGVTNNGEGVLGGHAWGEKLDWINFSGVTIDTQGRFHGTASGSLIGTLSFDCDNCNVKTDWRPVLMQKTFSSDGDIFTGATTEARMPPSTPKEEQAPLFDVVQTELRTSNGNLVTRVAPGEPLPVSVHLTNFGGGQKVDVTITYKILNSKAIVVLTTSETVAVETTASFVKVILIPSDFTPGIYTAESSIKYLGQKVPATSDYTFTVERKILGLFQSDFLLYGGITLLVGIFMLVLGHILIKRRRAMRLTPFDYSDVSHDMRTFYEILSDTIMEMRERVGDDALVIASNIDGLKIDKETGRVLALTEHPSKIIATLVSEYEKILGKKVSFSLRRS